MSLYYAIPAHSVNEKTVEMPEFFRKEKTLPEVEWNFY